MKKLILLLFIIIFLFSCASQQAKVEAETQKKEYVISAPEGYQVLNREWVGQLGTKGLSLLNLYLSNSLEISDMVIPGSERTTHKLEIVEGTLEETETLFIKEEKILPGYTDAGHLDPITFSFLRQGYLFVEFQGKTLTFIPKGYSQNYILDSTVGFDREIENKDEVGIIFPYEFIREIIKEN